MISKDEQDVADLISFIREKKRSPSEVQCVINCMAHCKYPFGKTQKGHQLRMDYKNWLRHQLRRHFG